MPSSVEVWKPVVGYEGLYEVSDQGRVRSLRTGMIMSNSPHKSLGYVLYKLSANGRRKDWYGHALVLSAFVGPRPTGSECRHLNGIRNDNRLLNLAWGTSAENDEDRRAHGTLPQGEAHANAKLSELDVKLIRASYGTQASIAKKYNVSQSLVSMIKSGARWAHLQ
jgi:hypothetical protein